MLPNQNSLPDSMKKFQRLSEEGVGTGLRWWAEVALVLIFYIFYSAIRNQFGSASVSSDQALKNASKVTIRKNINNSHRTVGTTLSHKIA